MTDDMTNDHVLITISLIVGSSLSSVRKTAGGRASL